MGSTQTLCYAPWRHVPMSSCTWESAPLFDNAGRDSNAGRQRGFAKYMAHTSIANEEQSVGVSVARVIVQGGVALGDARADVFPLPTRQHFYEMNTDTTKTWWPAAYQGNVPHGIRNRTAPDGEAVGSRGRCGGLSGGTRDKSRWQLLIGMLARTAGAVTPETADRQAAPNDCVRPQHRYRRKDYALSSSGPCSLRRFCRQECWHYSTVNARRRYHSKVAITWSAIAHFWSAKRQHPTPRVLMLRVEFVMWTLSSLGAQT